MVKPEFDENKYGIKYSDFIGIKYLNEIPIFAQLIFINRHLNEREKKKFADNFLIDYLTDDNFRAECQNFYVFFYDGEYKGVYSYPKIQKYEGLGRKVLITDTPMTENLLCTSC